MECPACGSPVPPGSRFCTQCGTPQTTSCPACESPNPAGSRFCGQCGNPLGANEVESGAAVRPPSELAERRLVTVLFVDLVGFTSFASGRDAEDVRSVLGRYFDVASEAVQRHGGVVEKFIGDAVMAVWGTPVAHENDAERAVRTALEIVPEVAALGRSQGLPLQARAGVLTGEAVASPGASDQRLVAGDLVNTASRLQAAAEPGAVLVGEGTFRAAASAIAFTAVEPLQLKGKSEPVHAWRAERVVAERGGHLRGAAPEPPFVGRVEELRLLKDLLHATGREGRPRLAVVSGIGGMGKSRLVWELQKYVDGLTENIYWHQGRCPSYGEGVTFSAVADMVRRRARIADGDEPDRARELLHASLDDLVADPEERAWLEPRIGHLLGLAPAPPGGAEELFGAWRRYFERVAELGTTVLVFEDVHWADPGLLEFIESLLAGSRHVPLIVYVLTRPELYERHPAWGAGRHNATRTHLEPLPDEAMRDLVTGYVEGLPSSDVERVVHRAEGIPLYAVETVRMLADRGVLEQVGDTYRAVAELGGELEIPHTLHALLLARMDGLPDPERTLLQAASVVGERFTVAGLSAVSGRPVDEVEPTVRALVRRELLDQDVDPLSPERGQYGFVQAVLREVAYSTLAKPARRTGHLAAARYFDSLGDDELAGVVASHYLEAYRAEPGAPDSEDLAVLARTWLTRAAERAGSLGSPEVALSHAEQALSLSVDPVERASTLALAAHFAAQVGDGERMGHLIEEAMLAAQRTGHHEQVGRLMADDLRIVAHRLPELGERMLRLAEEITRGREDLVRVQVIATMADWCSSRGAHEEALGWAEEAMKLAEQVDDDVALRLAASAKTWALGDSGRHWEAGLLIGGVVELARTMGSATELAQALTSLGVVLGEDDLRGCMEAFQEAHRIAARLGIRPLDWMNRANLAEAATDLGELGIAREALVGDVPADDPASDGMAFSLATIEALTGNVAEGIALLDTMEPVENRWPHIQMQTWFRRSRGLVRLAAGDPAGALEDGRTGLAMQRAGSNALRNAWVAIVAACVLRDREALADVLDLSRPLRGRSTLAMRATATASLHALDGDEGAAEAFAAALEEWAGIDSPLDHALASICAVHTLAAAALPEDQIASAREFLERIGAPALLPLLDPADADTPLG
ncbi:MAG TPA: AAA family ATPase [Actinomycetes bacterium]|nr:AAA family ATPase [Actinomycetes bacterium]